MYKRRGVELDALLSLRKGSRAMAEDKNKYILSINGMSKSFGRNKVLKHIDLNVKPGSIMGLMGENGAGKSTMMKCLFGTYQKDEGTIILDGREVNFSGPKLSLIHISCRSAKVLRKLRYRMWSVRQSQKPRARSQEQA